VGTEWLLKGTKDSLRQFWLLTYIYNYDAVLSQGQAVNRIFTTDAASSENF
jgi:hypothetical protein